MKPTKIILCLEACVGLAVVSLAGNLAVPPEGVDFGEVAAGTNSEKSVSVRNVGAREIRISRVKPCTAFEN